MTINGTEVSPNITLEEWRQLDWSAAQDIDWMHLPHRMTEDEWYQVSYSEIEDIAIELGLSDPKHKEIDRLSKALLDATLVLEEAKRLLNYKDEGLSIWHDATDVWNKSLDSIKDDEGAHKLRRLS